MLASFPSPPPTSCRYPFSALLTGKAALSSFVAIHLQLTNDYLLSNFNFRSFISFLHKLYCVGFLLSSTYHRVWKEKFLENHNFNPVKNKNHNPVFTQTKPVGAFPTTAPFFPNRLFYQRDRHFCLLEWSFSAFSSLVRLALHYRLCHLCQTSDLPSLLVPLEKRTRNIKLTPSRPSSTSTS